MFNYNRLYTSWGHGTPAEIIAHAACFNYMSDFGNDSELNSLKNQLNLQTAVYRPVAQSIFDRYLLARDQFGYQVYIGTKDFWYDVWPAIFAGPFAGPTRTTTLCAGLTFSKVADWAELIATDILSQIPDVSGTKVFLAGHHVGGVIAAMIGQKLSTTNRTVGHVVTYSQPRCFDEAMWNALTQDIISVWNSLDCMGECPPPILWNPAAYGLGVQLPTQMYFKGRTITFSDNRSMQIRNAVSNFVFRGQNRYNWPDAIYNWIQDDAPNDVKQSQYNNSKEAYVLLLWDRLREEMKVVIDEWREFMNTTFGFSLRTGKA